MKVSTKVILTLAVLTALTSAGAIPIGNMDSNPMDTGTSPIGEDSTDATSTVSSSDMTSAQDHSQAKSSSNSLGISRHAPVWGALSTGSGTPAWSFATGAQVKDVDITDDGRWIAVGSLYNKLYLFDWEGTKIWEKDIPVANAGWPRTTHSVAVSDGGRYVAAGATDNNVYVFDKKGDQLWNFNTGSSVITVDLAHNGRFVVAASSSTFRVFDIDGNQLWSDSVACSVRNARIDHNGKWLAVSTHCNRLYLYENLEATGGSGGTQIWMATLDDAYVNADISADGRVVAAGVDDPGDQLWSYAYRFDHMKDGVPGWSAADGSPVWSFQEPDDFYTVSVSPDGKYIVAGATGSNSGFTDGESDLLQGDSNVPVQSWMTGPAQSSDVSLNGKYAVIGNGATLYLGEKESSTPAWSYTTGGTVAAVGISKSGGIVVAGSLDGSVYVFYN